jgi:hypothetical protein
MVRYLFRYASETELGPISRKAWQAQFKNAELHTIDERDENSSGLIRVVNYDPDTETRPWKIGEIQFTFPDDREAYERYTSGD